MAPRSLTAAIAACGAAGAAAAQQTATYSFVFASPTAISGNGTANILVRAGAVVTAQVLVTINPGIGSPGNGPGTLTGTILGLSFGGFSITGAGSTGSGSGWGTPCSPTAPYNFIGTSRGTLAGQSVNGVVWGLGFLLGSVHPLPENPAKVWSGTYNTGNFGGNTIVNLSFNGLSATTAWILPAGGTFPFEGNFASNPGVGGSIEVICPAPTGPALLALGGLAALRRRRQDDQQPIAVAPATGTGIAPVR